MVMIKMKTAEKIKELRIQELGAEVEVLLKKGRFFVLIRVLFNTDFQLHKLILQRRMTGCL